MLWAGVEFHDVAVLGLIVGVDCCAARVGFAPNSSRSKRSGHVAVNTFGNVEECLTLANGKWFTHVGIFLLRMFGVHTDDLQSLEHRLA